MSLFNPIIKQGLSYLTKQLLAVKSKKRVPIELQQAINDCTTLEQLLELLFSTDFIKDEAIMNAFDKRIDELEGSC